MHMIYNGYIATCISYTGNSMDGYIDTCISYTGNSIDTCI